MRTSQFRPATVGHQHCAQNKGTSACLSSVTCQLFRTNAVERKLNAVRANYTFFVCLNTFEGKHTSFLKYGDGNRLNGPQLSPYACIVTCCSFLHYTGLDVTIVVADTGCSFYHIIEHRLFRIQSRHEPGHTATAAVQ